MVVQGIVHLFCGYFTSDGRIEYMILTLMVIVHFSCADEAVMYNLRLSRVFVSAFWNGNLNVFDTYAYLYALVCNGCQDVSNISFAFLFLHGPLKHAVVPI